MKQLKCSAMTWSEALFLHCGMWMQRWSVNTTATELWVSNRFTQCTWSAFVKALATSLSTKRRSHDMYATHAFTELLEAIVLSISTSVVLHASTVLFINDLVNVVTILV